VSSAAELVDAATEGRANRAELSARWYQEGFYGTTTLADEMRIGAATHPEAQMVFASDLRPAQARLGDMYRDSARVAAGLQSLGIGAGDIVAVQVPNWLEGALMYQAAMMIGAVVVPIVHIYGPAEVGFILRQSRARMLVIPDRWRNIDYLERVSRLGDTPDLEHIVVIGDHWPAGTIGWKDLIDRTDSEVKAPDLHPDDVCLLIYTSGTTAEPKGVQHTHNTLLAEVRTLHKAVYNDVSMVTLAAFPSGHIAGVLNLTRLFVFGTTMVLMDTWDGAQAVTLVDQHLVGATAGTPFHLTTLLDAAEQAGSQLRSFQSYMVGAANVTPSLVSRASEFGISAFRCYGSSEHPTISSGTAFDDAEHRCTTDGRLISGCEVRIVDEEDRDVPFGGDGEIVTRGPDQFVGYRDPALNADAFMPGGWFRTGDIGRLDAEGWLTITDRKKDLINRGGEKISSKEVEDLLVLLPAVAEAAVVAMADPLLGERVCAFVTVNPGTTVELDEVQRHFAAAGVARQKTPERLEIVDEFPRTPAGKVKKFELRDRLR
jgi:non-ribosomal peptide synthetase component E (peptide arylation enzyme)